jgi:hypothetical protein
MTSGGRSTLIGVTRQKNVWVADRCTGMVRKKIFYKFICYLSSLLTFKSPPSHLPVIIIFMSSHSSQLIAQQASSTEQHENCRSLLPNLSTESAPPSLSVNIDTEQTTTSISSPTGKRSILSSLLNGEGDGSGDARAIVDHPYARITARTAKSLRTRRSWNHALEKSIFTSEEL